MVSTCGHLDFPPDYEPARRIGMGVAAAVYQQLGCSVLPLVRGGKKPHRMLPPDGGVHHASREGSQVTQWWAQDPAANIGVATGTPSGLVLIDLDVKGEASGPAEFWRFVSGLGGGISTDLWHSAIPYVSTPSGGRHLWLRWPPHWGPVPERPGILPGVDIKGDGGLAVVPPSMQLKHPAARPGETGLAPVPLPYYWHGCLCEAPQAPDWLPQWLAASPVRAAAGGDGLAGEGTDLGRLRAEGIPRGQRNQVMYRAACAGYRQYGSGPGGSATVLRMLADIWTAGDRTDFGWREVLVIAESARRFIAGQQEKEKIMMERSREWLER